MIICGHVYEPGTPPPPDANYELHFHPFLGTTGPKGVVFFESLHFMGVYASKILPWQYTGFHLIAEFYKFQVVRDMEPNSPCRMVLDVIGVIDLCPYALMEDP